MKKLLSVALCLVLIFSALPVFAISANAASTRYVEGIYTYTITNDEATITDCDAGISMRVTVPDVLGGSPVTAIGYRAFRLCVGIRTVAIPDSIKTIGGYAFENCTSLTTVNFGNGVEIIEEGAFHDCDSLRILNFGNGIKTIGNSAFSGCTSLSDVIISDSVTSIGQNAFSNCIILENIKLPVNLKHIDKGLLSGCTSLTNLIIPDSVTSIYTSAFSGCNFISVTIPNGVKNITYDPDGFSFKVNNIYYRGTEENRKEIVGSNTHGPIRYSTWYYNSCIGSATHTYDNGCDSECNVCGNVRTVGDHVYDNACDATCNECGAVRDLSVLVFGTCGNNISWELNTATKVLKLTGTGITYNYDNGNNKNPFVEHRANIESIVIGDGITRLGNRLFRGLSQVESVTFGKDITTMGHEVFYSCGKLAKVELNEGLTALGSLAFYNCKKLAQITIPSTVTNINSRAFKGTGLTSIDLPDTVKTMGYEVFMNCASLESVDYTRGVSMLSPRTFENCTSLKSFYFTSNMCRIRQTAFAGCTALESIIFEDANNMWGSSDGSEARIASNAFTGCNSTLQMIAKQGHVKEYAAKHGFTFVEK